ncbi:MAG TPA: DUF4347 domain-containing protein, partial [Candidatus Binatia bacterium]
MRGLSGTAAGSLPAGSPCRSRPSSRIVFEALEPRFLMSADPVLTPVPVVEPPATAPSPPAIVVSNLAGESALEGIGSPPVEGSNSVPSEKNPSAARKELAFVDQSVADYQQIVSDLLSQQDESRQLEVHLLDPTRDGIEQINDVLAGHSPADAIHFISHGTPGAIELGATWLDSESLQAAAETVRSWRGALAQNADLLFYGCDLAATAAGTSLLEQLSTLTGADVAGSVNRTGASALGGDWNLEFSTGKIETAVAIDDATQQSWLEILSTASVQASQDTYIKLKAPDDTKNFGASSHLIVDRESADLQRALLEFDLSGIPANATINSAVLKMQSTQIGGALNINVYEVLQSWSEGTASGTADTANWDQRSAGVNWTTAGGTFDPTPVATLNTSSLGQHTWDITSLVQAWVNGTKTNNGIMVASPDGGGNRTVTYDSREGTTKPVLVIDYTPTNLAPVNTVPGAQTTPQDTPITFSNANGNSISTSDADAGGANLQVTITATNGTVTLGWPSATANAAGGEFRVNSTTADRQALVDGEFYGAVTNDFGSTRAVASDRNGNFVVTWSSKNQDGTAWGIYAQRYDQAGVAQGGEFLVNTTTDKDQVHSSVAMDDTGNFVIVWASKDQDGDNWGIFGQRYDSAGVEQGSEFQINTYTTKEQLAPSVAMDSGGDFVVTWTSKDQDSDNWGVYAKRFDASGVAQGGEFRVNNTTTKEQMASSVAIDASGRFVITWSSNEQDGDKWGVYAKQYDASGVPVANEFQVNTTVAQEQMFPSVAADAAGDFVITWSSRNQDGDTWGVYAQRYNAAGVAQGGEFRVNVTTTKEQMDSSVAMDADGDFVITWTSNNQDGGGRGIYSRQYTPAGVAKTGEILVNTTTSGDQEYSSAAMDARGDFTVVWTGNGTGDTLGVFGQRFTVTNPLTFISGDGTRDTTVSFRGTLTDINSALQGLEFAPNPGFNGTAIVSLTTNDLGNTGSGGAKSDTDTINITVGTVNVAPTLTLTGGALNYTENNPATVIDASATVTDPDSANFAGGQLTVSFSANGTDEDRLSIRNQGTGVGQISISGANVRYNPGSGPTNIGTFSGGSDAVTPLRVVLNTNATVAAVQALLRNITYQNVSDNPSTFSRTVEFIVSDGDGGTSNSASRLVNVAAVNDSPTASNLNAAETYTANTPVNLADIIISDVDSVNVTATLTLSDTSAGTLSTGTSGTVTSTYNPVTGVWQASGALADVNALLAGVTFTPAGGYISSFSIATSVDDGAAPPLTGSKNMTGALIDIPPIVTNLSAGETYIEDTPLSLTPISVIDLDSPNITAQLTLSDPAAGILSTDVSGSVTSTYDPITGV